MGREKYPESAASTYDLLLQISGQVGQTGNNRKTQRNQRGQRPPRLMFSQRYQNNQGNSKNNNNSNGEYLVPRTGRHKIPVLDCYKCVKPAHMYFNCNEPDHRRNSTVNIFQIGYIFKKHNNKDIL